MKKFNCSGSWDMSYNETVDFVVNEFLDSYGVKPPKSSVIIKYINSYSVYSKEFDDYEEEYTIEFFISPTNSGRSHYYILKYSDGHTEMTHPAEH